MQNKISKAFSYAFPLTVPIAASFLLLGISYGLFAVSKGFPPILPIAMSALIFAGSMEFVMVSLLLMPFDPLGTFLLTLMVNARHIFYGLAMLEKYGHIGWKKYFTIFGMCDESFAINVSTEVPNDVDKGWFYLHVTFLNQFYWVGGATIGALIGKYLSHLPTKGIEFILTAMFVVILLDLCKKNKGLRNGAVGIVSSVICLAVFGVQNFIVPTMLLILIVFLGIYKWGDN